MDFNETYQAYEATLNNMKAQCATAEKNCIVAETNLKSLEERYAKLVSDCQTVAQCPIEQIPEMLTQAQQDLTNIMHALMEVDITGEIDDQVVADIKKIMADFGI